MSTDKKGVVLPTMYQSMIHLSRYARWNEEQARRETWQETITRLMDFWEAENETFKEVRGSIEPAILHTEVAPSMRTLMTAGIALHKNHIAAYNCAYVAVDSLRVFDEILYVLMHGTGVGFTVERQSIAKLPNVAEGFEESDTTVVVEDSKEGWQKAYRELVALLYNGQVPKWDTSRVRPVGSRLKTFGGRASGPEPLEDLFKFTVEVFKHAEGRKLSSIECHDLVCKIAEVVVVGGVRRSALISLSNLTDERMRNAKSGAWWEDNPQRALANNSVCYTEKPDMAIFMREWESLYSSKSGERGIFNREAAINSIPERRKAFEYKEFGCNPCSEILLRSKQFCNLTEVVIRKEDTFASLKEKVRLATILGTFQATLTNFRGLTSGWKKNTVEEALLGVSFTGIMDNPVMAGRFCDVGLYDGFEDFERLEDVLVSLKEYAVEVNKEWAEKLGINQASAVTCVKPSGTVSQLVNSSSGIHTRYSPHYIRTVRSDRKDPLTQMMIDKGFPNEPQFQKEETGVVFSFPIKSPEGSVCTEDVDVLQQLELWKTYQEHWTEHKPSVTINVRDHEWMTAGSWVWDNFDMLSGISFLPFEEHSYRQAPYQEANEESYTALLDTMPQKVDWKDLSQYEKEDTSESYKELACSSGSCEI